jgi:exodeoxyribonuclease V beta subunit
MELDIMQQAKEYLQRARKEIRHTGWGAFFSHFISSKWNNEGLSIEEDLLSREDTTLYFELRQMMQLIQETAGPALFSIDGFATYFASLSSLSTSDDTFKIPAETEEDEVVMMTIHASKGLEFDVVFAIGLVCRGGGIDDLVTIRRDKDQHLMRWDDNDPSCVMASLELDAEKMRHLYVALTRAKDRVYVPIAIETDQKNVPLSSASSIELFCQSFGKERFDVLQAYSELSSMTESKVVEHLNRLKFLASVTYTLLADEGALAPCNLSGNEKSNLIFTPQRLPYFPTRKILSFSSLHGDHEIGPIASISDDLPGDILPLGADTGTCIHDIMETILKEGLHHPLDEEGIYKCIEKKLQDSPLIAYLYTIKNLILESLCAPLITGSCSFSLCDVRKEHLFLEMEFSYAMEGGRMKGFIDAVCFFNGAYYILDWKTNYLGMDRQSYSKETVEAAMGQSGYFMQASIYQEALMRYLTLFDKRPFTQIFGGAIYLFMRMARWESGNDYFLC